MSAELVWPGEDWELGPCPAGADATVTAILDEAMAQPAHLGLTAALLVVHRGRIVAEAYGPETDPDTTLISWSMAKSMTQAVIGMLVGDGLLDIHAPAPIDEWQHDSRRDITVHQLLTMSSGLQFVEDYVDDSVSDVIEMLFGTGQADCAAYAVSKPLAHPPGTVWSYASGTTNILARIASATIGGGQAGMEAFLAERLFGPLGMRSAIPKFDAAGTFIGSSFVYATARDFARFGLLYLADGVWNGERLLPEGWVAAAHTPAGPPIPDGERHGYGAHWWRWFHRDDTFSANGYETQRIVVSPARDLVVVRLGKTPAESGPEVDRRLDDLVRAF